MEEEVETERIYNMEQITKCQVETWPWSPTLKSEKNTVSMSKTGNFDIKEIIQLVSDNFCLGITVTEKKSNAAQDCQAGNSVLIQGILHFGHQDLKNTERVHRNRP